MTLPVLVINRAQDAERLDAFRQSASKFGVDAIRVDALDAHRPNFPFTLYADLLRDRFWDSDQIKPGAIGCFLSHRRAWQHVVDNDLPMALICEDDAGFLASAERLPRIAKMLPDFDLVFANARLAAWCSAAGEYDLKPLAQVLEDLAKLGGPKGLGLKPTPGGDCYLVSNTGAAALLGQTKKQGILCGVDWAMVWNSAGTLSDDVQQAFPELQILSSNAPPDAPLNAYVLADPIADQRNGPSVLKHAISLPIAELLKRESTISHAEAVSTIRIGQSSLCFACRSGPDPVMEAHRSGQIWDEAGLCALLAKFPNGGVFVDIGAHSGNHSAVMATLGGAGRVLAIEANPEIHRLLRTNMTINGALDRFVLHPSGIALASKPGRGWLIRNRRRSSETMVKLERPTGEVDPSASVELITGDQMLAGETVHAIKIDTSGSEVDVLKGLTETLKQHHPQILLDHASQSVDRIIRLADDVSYRVASTHASGRKNRSSSLLIPLADAGQ